MRTRSLLIVSLLLLTGMALVGAGLVGAVLLRGMLPGYHVDNSPEPEPAVQQTAEDPEGSMYGLPLHITIEPLPEVPEKIRGPFPVDQGDTPADE